MIPYAPAVVAALHDATGVWFDTFPLTPDRVVAGLRAHGVGLTGDPSPPEVGSQIAPSVTGRLLPSWAAGEPGCNLGRAGPSPPLGAAVPAR